MNEHINFAFFDEGSKREIRRATLKAVAIPGYQVPFASREMPIARGWGTGGLQLTLSCILPEDHLKVIDQGSDESVNAISIKNLITSTTGVQITQDTEQATLIQSRHRIPEVPLSAGQILVLQVPTPEPLRSVEPSERLTKKLHAEAEYSGAWLIIRCAQPAGMSWRLRRFPSLTIRKWITAKLSFFWEPAGRKKSMPYRRTPQLFRSTLRTFLLKRKALRGRNAACAGQNMSIWMKFWMQTAPFAINAMIQATV